jgi:hypothetical protein
MALSSPAETAASSETTRRAETIERLAARSQARFHDVREITVEALSRPESAAGHVIVDVRTAAERKVSVIPGSIALEAYEKNRGAYAGRTIVFYCTAGYRSAGSPRKRCAPVKAPFIRSITTWIYGVSPAKAPMSRKAPSPVQNQSATSPSHRIRDMRHCS